MSEGLFHEEFTYDARALRPGQRMAIDTVVTRITAYAQQILTSNFATDKAEAALRATTIVAPTRYGKSDVIKLTTMILKARKLISCAVVMSPNKILRDQIGDSKRFDTTMVRYSAVSSLVPRLLILEKNPHNFTRNGEIFVSVTMAMVQQHLSSFIEFVKSQIAQHGVPPVFFIDEAHTGSESNQWGKAVVELVNTGAYAILLTATPIRSDGLPIPGFECREIGEEALRVKVADRQRPADEGKVWINILEGRKRTVALVPHHETTFQQAWNEEPSPLCKITRLPFDAELSRITEASIEEGGMLSEASESLIRRHLTPICRDPIIIREACLTLVRELAVFKRLKANAAAIVFCGNDRADDPGVNQHAQMIADLLQESNPTLDTVIATSADGDNTSSDKIKQFETIGDVLIVKQMASLGLDIPRLKVGVDLSSIRTYAASVQRMMRIATVDGAIKHAVWITPDDCISRTLFEAIVTSQGGEAVATDMQKVDAYQTPTTEGTREAYLPNNAAGSNFQDTLLNESEADRLILVHELIRVFPEVIGHFSHPEVDQRIMRHGLKITLNAEQQTVQPAVEFTQEAKKRRDAITVMAKRMTTAKIGKQFALFQETIPTIYSEIKQHAGIPPWVKLDETQHDLNILTSARQSAQQLAVKYGVRPC